jgi:hypothetical protein
MHDLGVAIGAAQLAAYRRRGREVLEELRSRMDRRQIEATAAIQTFFSQNPGLAGRERLIAAVLPWVMVDDPTVDAPSALRRAGEVVKASRPGPGLTGTWHGIMAQTTVLQDGRTVSFSHFIRVRLNQLGDRLTGTGELGSGEKLEISAWLRDGKVEGVAANTTSAINSTFVAIPAENQFVGDFEAIGVGEHGRGTVALFR